MNDHLNDGDSGQPERRHPASPRRVAVIGAGYVGLTTAACLAHIGEQIGATVVLADVDAPRIARLQAGQLPIVESGLDAVVDEATRAGRLSFVVGASVAVEGADTVFLCVPTPQDADGSADLSYIEDVAKEIGPVLMSGAVVVNKSTVPVGSSKVVERALQRRDVSVVSNPEFLREGSAVSDFLHPDRVVIGGSDPEAAARVAALYAPLDAPVLLTDEASAETIKYVANGFLAMKLSYVNAVAAVCEAVGADVEAVIEGLGSDHRIGTEFLRPGPGWGGSCFPKDTRALVAVAAQHGYDFTMMRDVIAVNDEQRERMVRKVAQAVNRAVVGYRPLEGVIVGVLGLTFKAGTDDLRESPSLAIIGRLGDLGAAVVAYDPTVEQQLNSRQSVALAGVRCAESALDAVRGADVVMIATEWPEFADLDLHQVRELMAGDALVDTRNLLRPDDVATAGLRYVGVGRR